jgi:hypothetical protein
MPGTDVRRVSLTLRFRNEPPLLDSIVYSCPPYGDETPTLQNRDWASAVAIVLLLFRASNASARFRVEPKKKTGTLVHTILNLKKQPRGASPPRDFANGAFLNLFSKRPTTNTDNFYLELDVNRLQPAAVHITHDGRTIDDPDLIKQMAFDIATAARWLMVDYSFKVESRDPTFSRTDSSSGFLIPPCPYKGLFPFWEEDAEVFFGRESLIQLLREKLEQKQIIQVSGPSGSGKSSLVAAGLIPALKRSDSWQILYCRPGGDPFGSLAFAINAAS